MKALYYGDNLIILRDEIANESVDLIYLDPPFNSKATYNVLFKSPEGVESEAQVEAFEDTWHWTAEAEQAFDEVITSGNTDAADMLNALRSFLGENDMMAYLTMMAVRLIELHKVLKKTGSLYLHCDPTASHYLKVLLDAVFGGANFRSEIIWKRSHAHSSAKRWGPIHDTLLFYTKSNNYTWNPVYQPYDQDYIDNFFKFDDNDGRKRYWTGDLTGAGTRNGPSGDPWRGYDVRAKGRHWAYSPDELDRLDADSRIYWPPTEGAMPKLKRYLSEAKGIAAQDILVDAPSLQKMSAAHSESLGYPTQKPLNLLERIIEASSNLNDMVLDPFCGCGTAVHAAEKLNRDWIGIDVTHLAISLIEKRLKEAFPGITYVVHGTPKDLDGAKALAAADKYEFQWWAVSLVDAMPYQGKKKGADEGIDGIIYCRPDGKKIERVIVSVKGGKNINVAMIRDLKGVLEREKAPLGLFITLTPPTKPMVKEAAAAGVLDTPWGKIPRIQIATIEDLLHGKKPEIPGFDPTLGLKQAKKEETVKQEQLL